MTCARLVALAFLLIVFASCDDSLITPPDRTDTKAPFDSTGFAILATTPDTLYYGEEAWIKVNDLGNDVSDLRLFVHTVEVEEMRIEGDRLIFEVPRNAPTARLRLYKHDSLLAKNDFTLHVLPHHIDEFHTQPHHYFPVDGYPGEFVTLFVVDMPLRRTEFDLFLDQQKLTVARWDSSSVRFEIPDKPGIGTLTMRAFDEVFPIGDLEVRTHGGAFLDSRVIHSVVVLASSLAGSMTLEVNEQDSLVTTNFPAIDFNSYLSIQPGAEIQRGDSIRIASVQKDHQSERILEVALLPAVGRNTVSGRIMFKQITGPSAVEEQNHCTIIEVKDISWKYVDDNYYVLYAYGKEITEKVTSVYYEIDQFENSLVHRVTDYTGGHSQSYFELRFLP